MELWGHIFSKYFEEERICRSCGYVTPQYNTIEEMEKWILQETGGQEVHCGHEWHKRTYKDRNPQEE